MRALLIVGVVLGCGVQRSSSSANDVHGGEIDCHGVLAPAQGGGKKALLLCTAGRAACESSKAEQAKKGLEVYDCSPHPSAACFPNGTGQMCLGSMRDCRDFAEAVERDAGECTIYESDAPASAYSAAYAGHYDTDRGPAIVLQRGAALEVLYSGGKMLCHVQSTNIACAWEEKGGHGRARFAHGTDGAWVGTYGSGDNETGSAWTFHRAR